MFCFRVQVAAQIRSLERGLDEDNDPLSSPAGRAPAQGAQVCLHI